MRKEAALLVVLATLGWGAAPAAASDVLARWTFNEGAGQLVSDTSPAQSTGTLGSLPVPEAVDPAWVPGHDGAGALAFTGSEYVTVPGSAALEPARVGVDAWVRAAGSPGSWRYVLAKGALGCDRSAYGLYSGFAGGMAFYLSSASSYYLSPEVPAARVWDGAWHHVTGSYDGQRVRLWIDGAQVGNGTATNVAIAYGVGSKGVYLGMYRGSCDLGFKGSIDDVRVWNGPPTDPAQPLPVVDPVRNTPTRIPVVKTPGADVYGSKTTAARGSRGCLRVTLSRRTVKLNALTRVVATVRRGTKRLVGVRVAARGAGVSASARTNRKGRAGLMVTATRRGKLKVRLPGRSTTCAAVTMRAR